MTTLEPALELILPQGEIVLIIGGGERPPDILLVLDALGPIVIELGLHVFVSMD